MNTLSYIGEMPEYIKQLNNECTNITIKTFKKIRTVHFNGGHPHVQNQQGAKKICKFRQDTFGLSNWPVLVLMTIHSGDEDVLMEM